MVSLGLPLKHGEAGQGARSSDTLLSAGLSQPIIWLSKLVVYPSLEKSFEKNKQPSIFLPDYCLLGNYKMNEYSSSFAGGVTFRRIAF